MPSSIRKRILRRTMAASALAFVVALAAAVASWRQNAKATARLNFAAEQLDSLTDRSPADDTRRAAIVWGYAERLRLGLESPFRLIESAARDRRLTSDERRTVAWALLAHVVRGETHEVNAAALDLLGSADGPKSAAGEQHLALIERTIAGAEHPRAAELAVRLAYTLAAAERIVDASAPVLAAEAAAMVADRELARREAREVVRSSARADPIDAIRRRRARRAFYVERPALLLPSQEIERDAIATATGVLGSLRSMRPSPPSQRGKSAPDASAAKFGPRLFAAGAQLPPSAPLAVTVRRYLPLVRAHVRDIDADALARTRNGEMLVGVTRGAHGGRQHQRVMGRLLLGAAVAMRSVAQEPVWFPGDSVPSAAHLASHLGVRGIAFDRDVPAAWRPYFVWSLANGVADLRRVLPTLRLDGVQIRFRMNAPSDSALAMHDPRTRTLHFPVVTGGGTLTHELAHDLDRQSAERQGLNGYRSDVAARGGEPERTAGVSGRLAASLRALAEELSGGDVPSASGAVERPAEIFATRVDWFVASALARQGISSGFLSAVQDEVLTGHVVHPDRLRSSGRSRSLVTALEAMTSVAPFASRDEAPSAQTLLRWSLAARVDRRVAAEIARGDTRAWMPGRLVAERCDAETTGRAQLVRMAAESRARGWLRLRARWTPDSGRSDWARSMLRQGPWSDIRAEQRVAELRDYVLVQLASGEELPAGLSAYGASLALRARCSG